MHLPITSIFVLFEPTMFLTNPFCFLQTRYPVTKTDEGYNPKEELFFVSKQLKMVEIRCAKKNNLVEKLLLLLMTNGVPSEQIQIEQNFSPPDCMLLSPFSISLRSISKEYIDLSYSRMLITAILFVYSVRLRNSKFRIW